MQIMDLAPRKTKRERKDNNNSVLFMLHAIYPFIFSVTLQDRDYYYPHFMYEKTEAWRA